MSLENWQIGNIGTPDLVDRNNVDPSQQIWIHLVLWVRLTQLGLGINRL